MNCLNAYPIPLINIKTGQMNLEIEDTAVHNEVRGTLFASD